MNPSYLWKKGASVEEELERNRTYELQDGDRVSVFLWDFPVSFHIEGASQEPTHSLQGESEDRGSKENFSLALLSISTLAFEFDIDVAVDVAFQEITQFLKEHPDPSLRVYFVDITDSHHLRKFRERFARDKHSDSRFSLMVADITKMYSAHGIKADCIVNAANSTLSSKGSGANRAIHDAAGPQLQTLSRKQHPSRAVAGRVYPVELPEDNPLFSQEHVQYVCSPTLLKL